MCSFYRNTVASVKPAAHEFGNASMAPPPAADSFRGRLLRGDLLVGTFLKTPTLHGAEILGVLGFDFLIVDEEHSPFDRQSTDAALFAARAAGSAGLRAGAEPGAAPPPLRSGLRRDGRSGAACRDRRAGAARGGGLPLPRREARLFRLDPRCRLWRGQDVGLHSRRRRRDHRRRADRGPRGAGRDRRASPQPRASTRCSSAVAT